MRRIRILVLSDDDTMRESLRTTLSDSTTYSLLPAKFVDYHDDSFDVILCELEFIQRISPVQMVTFLAMVQLYPVLYFFKNSENNCLSDQQIAYPFKKSELVEKLHKAISIFNYQAGVLKQAEQELANILVDSSPIILIRCLPEPGFPIVFVSKNIQNYGTTQAAIINQNLQIKDLISPGDYEVLLQKIDACRQINCTQFETLFKIDLNGDSYWFDTKVTIDQNSSGEINYIQAVFLDATARIRNEQEQKRIEAKLDQQQRLESLGIFARGVAHEINNPLTGIINFAQLIHDKYPEPKIEQFSNEILHEGERISKIVQELSAFAKQEDEYFEKTPVHLVVDGAIKILKTILQRDKIKVHLDLPKDLPEISVRRLQFRHVLINILYNSRSALNLRFPHESPDKKIEISGAVISIEDKIYLRLTIEDFGIGIPNKVIGKLFDPFFTTKYRWDFSGMGLSMSYRIIEEHQGTISVDSQENEYTRYIINLPIDPD